MDEDINCLHLINCHIFGPTVLGGNKIQIVGALSRNFEYFVQSIFAEYVIDCVIFFNIL